MAKKRVIAHYMHESERNNALQRLTSAEDTGAYVVGEVDDSAIPALQKDGLIVEEVAEVPSLHADETFEAIAGPRRADMRKSGPRIAGGGAMDVTTAATPSDSSFYYVQLRGPLVEAWRSRLQKYGVTLLERYPNRVYKARLNTQQLQQLSADTDVVQDVREITGSDTGPDVMSPRAAAGPPLGAGVPMLTFDVRLHRVEDRPAVEAWLKAKGVAIAGTSQRKLRIYLLESSPLLTEIPALQEVASFEEYVLPKTSNDNARRLLGIDLPNPGLALGLEGAGQIVAIADTGLDQTHPDFAGRIVGIVARGRPGDPSDPNGHGTHVAGSVAGDGAASGGQVRGTAPKARIFFQSIMDANGKLGGLPVDLNDLFDEAYQQGARVHNNSWGAATPSMYTINSTEVDEFVATHRDMLIVIAAGNEGIGAHNVNALPGFVDWLSIGSPASCKNALTVGASRSDRTSGGFSTLTWGQGWPNDFPLAPISGETISGAPECLAAFSSRGPCDDRRIKPDLVAPGTDIVSTKSSTAPLANFWGPFAGHNGRYAFMGGTSMATPLVAGCAALVREYYVTQRGHQPSAALLRATLINGAQRLTGADSIAPKNGEPNYHQGYGRVNMQRTVPNPAQPALVLQFIDNWQNAADQFTATGQRRRYRFTVPAGTPRLSVTLAYTDLPARALQNNLNLFMQLPDNSKLIGNAKLPDTLNIPDTDNNVECIRIENPPAGNYLLQVSATNLLSGPQDFALVVTGDGISPLLTV
jgi:subtilisin family serine protease